MRSSPEVDVHRPHAVRSCGSAAIVGDVRGACRVTGRANRNGCATNLIRTLDLGLKSFTTRGLRARANLVGEPRIAELQDRNGSLS
jgi:hypothetical protein